MNTKTKILISIVLIILAISSRFLPHLWNFTAITAIALFASNYLGPRLSISIILISMFISDIFLGFYDYRLMIMVYLSFVLVAFIPRLFKNKKLGVVKIAGMSISSSVLFFLLTNWAVWYFGAMYSPDLSGLYSSYVAGLPFFRNALLGDLWYTSVLFGSYEFALYLKESYVKSMKRSRIGVSSN